MTDPELIDEKFGDILDLVIDGGIGGIEPSTVVKCTDDELEIIRQGKAGWKRYKSRKMNRTGMLYDRNVNK